MRHTSLVSATWRGWGSIVAGVMVLVAVPVEVNGQATSTTGDERAKRAKCEATSAKTLRNLAGATLGDALQGRTPGVTVTLTGGAAGAGRLRIRGHNSVRSGGPLIFLDGARMTRVRFTGLRDTHSLPLFEFVNPLDIDRIEVLRGAAATIQYGMDASDGVIRIFTKRGGGKPRAGDARSRCVPGND